MDGILGYVRRLGAMVGAERRAHAYADALAAHVAAVRESAARLPRRPKVYFEEWDEPMISAIRWVSELIGIAGGDDVFPQRAAASLGCDRIVNSGDEVGAAAPDIIIGSWCGKKFRAETVAARPGWSEIPAVRDGELHEVKSPLILQPGPAALTDGLGQLHRLCAARDRGAPRINAPAWSGQEMVMARKSASKPSKVGTQETGMPDDAGALLSDWLVKQNSLFSASLAQITGSQVAMLSSWLELQTELARQWQTQAAEWSQWAYSWQRGGEQLA